MKLPKLIVGFVALSALLLATPAQAKHKHKKNKHCRDDHRSYYRGGSYDRNRYDDRGSYYYRGGSYYAPGTEPAGWYDRNRYNAYRYW